jgi:hypothetical protein
VNGQSPTRKEKERIKKNKQKERKKKEKEEQAALLALSQGLNDQVEGGQVLEDSKKDDVQI